MRGAELAAHIDSATVRQPRVQQRDVRRGRRNAVQGVGGGGSLADHHEIGGGPEKVGQATPHQLVIVEQEDRMVWAPTDRGSRWPAELLIAGKALLLVVDRGSAGYGVARLVARGCRGHCDAGSGRGRRHRRPQSPPAVPGRRHQSPRRAA
jgi:hypothetical protein